MVCWASPNADSELLSDRRNEAMENIQGFKADKSLMASLEALEKSIKSTSGGLICIEGSIYKTPFLKVVGEVEGRGAKDPPAPKKQKIATASKGKGSSTKGKGKGKTTLEAEIPSYVETTGAVISIHTYPPSDSTLKDLKKAATVVLPNVTSTPTRSRECRLREQSSEGAAELPSTSKGVEGTKGKRGNESSGLIDGGRLTIDNAEEWLEKGLKTPMEKILKTIVDNSIDPKTVVTSLVRMQLVGEEGLALQREHSTVRKPTENHIGTLLVVLPLKFNGGKIMVRRGDETWSIDPAKSKSTVRCSWIAFKTDAAFEVDPVTDGTTQALLVYHLFGENRKEKKRGTSSEQIVLGKLETVAQRIEPDSPINRVGILLKNKYNPKDFTANTLRGHDRWLYNLLKESKYEVKLTFVRVLMTAWGFFDSRDWSEPEKRVQMIECGEEFMESEIWEVDLSTAEKWAPKKWNNNDDGESPPHYADTEDHHKCRRLPWEMPWLQKSLFSAIAQMTRVDREPKPSWSEGLWLSETYRAAALIVTLKPEFKDGDDGPYTHFYPVAHPEPRGVSEREDMEWSKPVMVWRLPGDTQEECDEFERKFWARRNWVHKDLD